MTSPCVNAAVILLSVLQFTALGVPVSEAPFSKFDLAKDPDLVAVLLYGSDWPEFQNRNSLESSPLNRPEDLEYVSVDEDEDADNRLQKIARHNNLFLPETFRKRGIYNAERLDFFKRSSLNELIRRLMALRGNTYKDGRAYYMRFGAGKK